MKCPTCTKPPHSCECEVPKPAPESGQSSPWPIEEGDDGEEEMTQPIEPTEVIE